MRHRPPDGVLDELLASRFGPVAGVDEVGRGALAGPLFVAAVVLDRARLPVGLDDSKLLSAARRQRLARQVRDTAVAWSVAQCSVEEIDSMGIVAATRTAMARAVNALSPPPACVVCDALAPTTLAVPVFAEIRADGRYQCVAAASILAKVARDELMVQLAKRYPAFGWDRNKGYGTAEHLEALRCLGPSPLHRRSFAPVRVLALNSGRATG